jgi:hypothetical protein
MRSQREWIRGTIWENPCWQWFGEVTDFMSLIPCHLGVSTPNTSLLISRIFCERKSFRRERKAMYCDHVSNWTIVGSILRMGLKGFWMKIMLCLFLIRDTVLTWRHPTSSFSVILRHLLQVLYSMTSRSFLRRSSSFWARFTSLNCSLFSAAGSNEWNEPSPTMEVTLGGR